MFLSFFKRLIKLNDINYFLINVKIDIFINLKKIYIYNSTVLFVVVVLAIK